MKKDDAIFNVLRDYIKKSSQIRFEGDGYGKAWEEEAQTRGLSNYPNTPEALQAKISQKAIDLFSNLGIMNETEVKARYDIEIEDYSKHVQIEGRLIGDIARNHVIPTAIKYQNVLIENVKGLKEIYGQDFKDQAIEQMNIIEAISKHIAHINKNIDEMITARKKANHTEDYVKRAFLYCDEVKPYFEDIRYHCDKLELLVDDELWTLTKYRELLFIK